MFTLGRLIVWFDLNGNFRKYSAQCNMQPISFEELTSLWSRGNSIASHLAGLGSIPVGSVYLVEVFRGVFAQL